MAAGGGTFIRLYFTRSPRISLPQLRPETVFTVKYSLKCFSCITNQTHTGVIKDTQACFALIFTYCLFIVHNDLRYINIIYIHPLTG